MPNRPYKEMFGIAPLQEIELQDHQLQDLQLQDLLDNMPRGEAVGPAQLSLRQLKELTDDFSENRLIGTGSYAKVYKGIQTNGEEIAVKVLDSYRIGFDNFREFTNHRTLNHPNIVRVVGFCDEVSRHLMMHNGKSIVASEIHKALCLEYMHNGSLQQHISDEYDGFDWQTRYKIIKGTWEGLKYLHEGCDDMPIFHLDLKPHNILLDRNMVAKIADFGLSPFGTCQTHSIKDDDTVGTLGYLPPEYITHGRISKKFDIFSLGVVMIKIIAGPSGRSKSAEMSPAEFKDLVQGRWRNTLQATWTDSLLDGYCNQVKICTEIALNCMEEDGHRRPKIDDIIKRLNDTETVIDELKIGTDDPLVDQIR